MEVFNDILRRRGGACDRIELKGAYIPAPPTRHSAHVASTRIRFDRTRHRSRFTFIAVCPVVGRCARHSHGGRSAADVDDVDLFGDGRTAMAAGFGFGVGVVEDAGEGPRLICPPRAMNSRSA